MPVQKQPNVTLWAQTARPGERIIYAHRSGSGGTPTPSSAMDNAMEAHHAGMVFLMQRRDGYGGWNYEAHRVSPNTARLLGIHPDCKVWERGL